MRSYLFPYTTLFRSREAKERFSTLKAEYDEYRVKKKIEFKERETEILNKEKELQRKESELQNRTDGLESLEQEHQNLRETLNRQLKVLAGRKEELDRSEERRVGKERGCRRGEGGS